MRFTENNSVALSDADIDADATISEQNSSCENKVIEMHTKIKIPKKIPHPFMFLFMFTLISFSFLISLLKIIYVKDVSESGSLTDFQYYNLSMINDTIKAYFI